MPVEFDSAVALFPVSHRNRVDLIPMIEKEMTIEEMLVSRDRNV